MLAQYLSYRAAAERLHISQPRLSVHIADLEKELGFPLVNRTTPISLTEEGKLMVNVAAEVLGELDRAVGTCRKRAACQPPKITVSAPPFVSEYPVQVAWGLRSALSLIAQECPGITCPLPAVDRPLSEYDLLRDGCTDVGYVVVTVDSKGEVLSPIPDDICVRVVYRAPFAAWVGEGHPLSEASRVPLAELAEYMVLVPGNLELSTYQQAIALMFERKGLAPHYRPLFSDGPAAFVVTAPQENEVFVLPSFLAARNLPQTYRLKVVDIEERDCSAAIGVAFLRRSENPVVSRFVDILLRESCEGTRR